MIDGNRIANSLQDRFGLPFIGGPDNEPNSTLLRVVGVPAPNDFGIRIVQGWRRVDATFEPAPFASGLLAALGREDPASRAAFMNIWKSFELVGTNVDLQVNGGRCTVAEIPDGTWTSFRIKCSRLAAQEDVQMAAEETASACLALLLALLPLEDDHPNPFQGQEEGEAIRTFGTRYERNPANRAAAIAVHGVRCSVCGFDFLSAYGELGRGFIEIHHTVPVSTMGGGYIVDPATEMVPLCANCHRMVHRESPPVAVDIMRAIVSRPGESQ